VDAEFANHHDMKSQKGGVINLGGGTGIPDQPDKKSIQKNSKRLKSFWWVTPCGKYYVPFNSGGAGTQGMQERHVPR